MDQKIALAIFISILVLFNFRSKSTNFENHIKFLKNLRESENESIFESLLSKIKETKYRDFIDLYLSPDFKNALEKLKDSKYETKIIETMFHNISNTPVILSDSDLKHSYSYKRLPDIIGIGSKKCGTTAFQYYLGLHPEIKASQFEAHFFDGDESYQKGISHYLKKLPTVNNSSNVVFEKTPRLVVMQGIPEKIIQTHSHFSEDDNVLFVHIYCDPVKRVVSDFAHTVKAKEKKDNPCRKMLHSQKFKNGDLNFYLETMLPKIEACRDDTKKCPDSPRFNFNQTVKNAYYTDNKIFPGCIWSIVTNGFYSISIKEWIDHPEIGLEKMIFINGEDLIEDLPRIFTKFESILKDKRILRNKNQSFYRTNRFIRDDETGFWCYRPVGWRDGERKCVTDERPLGRTRGDTPNSNKIILSKKNRVRLERLYKPYMIEFEEMIRSRKI